MWQIMHFVHSSSHPSVTCNNSHRKCKLLFWVLVDIKEVMSSG